MSPSPADLIYRTINVNPGSPQDVEYRTMGPGSGPPGLDMTTGQVLTGWKIGPSGFPVAAAAGEGLTGMPYQGPSSPGFRPGPSAVYISEPPVLPGVGLQHVSEAALPYGVQSIIPAGAVVGYPDPLSGGVSGGNVLLDVLKGAAVGLVTGGPGGAVAGGIEGGIQSMATGQRVTNGTMGETVPVGGPGVPEPKYGVARQWKTKAFANDVGEYWVHFFRMMDGSMMSYNARKLEWKTWKPRKPIVLATVKPNMKTMGRAARFIANQFIQIDKAKKKLAKAVKS